MSNNWLKYLVGISAILIAGTAAYFSVTGLGVLFSGAAIAVMVMASSLEFAKLVSATYLKQKWEDLKGFNKWYLSFAVAVLMLITSAGIFGYLSNAFQQQNLKLDQVQREISVWENKIKGNNDQIATLTTQLNGLQSNQGTILEKGKVNSRLLRSVDNRDKQVNKLTDKINTLQDSVIAYNGKINEIKNSNISIEREVGGFRFVADAFGVELPAEDIITPPKTKLRPFVNAPTLIGLSAISKVTPSVLLNEATWPIYQCSCLRGVGGK
jgi:hypothetical protein